MEYVVSFFIQIVLALLMSVVFAIVSSLMAFMLAYIFSNPKNRSLNCMSMVLAAAVGSVAFGLLLFAVNIFVPYKCGVDYGFSDYHKVPMANNCSLISEDSSPFYIKSETNNICLVDSVAQISVIDTNIVCGQKMDETYFILNSQAKKTIYCLQNDSIYKSASLGRVSFDKVGYYYFKTREDITIKKTDFYGYFATLIAVAIALLALIVFRFLCKKSTNNILLYTQRNLMKQFAHMDNNV